MTLSSILSYYTLALTAPFLLRVKLPVSRSPGDTPCLDTLCDRQCYNYDETTWFHGN